jgi:hypothetical protein
MHVVNSEPSSDSLGVFGIEYIFWSVLTGDYDPFWSDRRVVTSLLFRGESIVV